MNIKDRLTKAKVFIMLYEPWFGQLASYLVFYPSKEVQTMAVSIKGEVFFNEDWVSSLTDKELSGVICHEILHLAYQHLARLGNRDPQLFNIAGDIKVNEEIVFNGDKFRLPKEAIIPYGNSVTIGDVKIHNIDEKSSEEIYDEVIRRTKKQDFVAMDSFVRHNIDSDEERKIIKDWQEKINIANETNKSTGNIPAGVLRELEKMNTPKLSWQQLIRQRLKLISINKSWNKPNKRMLPWYFAGRSRTKGLSCAVCIDTSGSMGDEELSQILAEIWGMSQQFKEIKFYIMCCDTELTEPFILTTRTKNLLKKIKLEGGGGTSFKPVFNWIKKESLNLDCLIYFTDLYGDFPEEKPMYNTYWVTQTDNIEVPFGRIIKLKI